LAALLQIVAPARIRISIRYRQEKNFRVTWVKLLLTRGTQTNFHDDSRMVLVLIYLTRSLAYIALTSSTSGNTRYERLMVRATRWALLGQFFHEPFRSTSSPR
jgi:hypothetical protein